MRNLLWIVLLLAFFIRVYHLNYNTTFLDEAQYISIGEKILHGDIESSFDAMSWVGGLPLFYPVISALFFEFGGIVSSRIFTVLTGTASVFLIYAFTKQLMLFRSKKANRTAGLIAAGFMAVTAIAISSSRMAIYDGLAFPLFFLGVYLFHKAIYSGERKFYLSSAGILFLSFLAKYIVLIFFPLLFLTPILIAYKTKQKESLQGVITYFCLPLILLTGFYIGQNFTNLKDFFIDQGVVQESSQADVIRRYFEYTGFGYFMVFLSSLLLWRNYKFLIIILVFFSFVPLIIHSLTGNTDSVAQHTVLSLLFILPIVGAGCVTLLQKRKKIGFIVTILALVMQVFISTPQVNALETFWPNLTEAVAFIKKDLKPNDRVLAEADDSMYLELKNILPQDQVNGPFVFDYDGKEGIEAYESALNDKYFKYVELEGTFFSEDDIITIEEALSKNYKKVFDDGNIRVYKVNK